MRFTAGHDIDMGAMVRDFEGQVSDEPRHYDTAGLPVMTHETWRLRECRGHHPSSCPVCAYFSELDRYHYAAPWARKHRVDRGLRWPSADAALMDYWAIVRDGYPAGSVSGSIVAFGRLGCWTQTSGRKDSPAEHAADDAVAVEQALHRAFPSPDWRRQVAALLGRRGLMQPLDVTELAKALGLGVDDVTGIVRRGMGVLRVELAARGLVPMPRRGGDMFFEVIRRIEELGHGARQRAVAKHIRRGRYAGTIGRHYQAHGRAGLLRVG